jgi:glycosyltransferase involved in cell wall biosynthesis
MMSNLTKSKLPITAIVLTLNEQSHIADCVQSLGFCDQVLVVDTGSHDATCSIARQSGAEVLQIDWRGYTECRNQALVHARHEWVLSIDADERVSTELEAELTRLLSGAGALEDAYTMPRKTIHFGRWIRYGGWYPNRLVRFFRKSQGAWRGDQIHEKWQTRGAQGSLKGDILHYSFADFSDQIARNNLYSTLGARKLARQGTKFTFVGLVVKTFSKFIETYFIKRGFLDGYPGFFISVSAAYSVFLKWAKLWELERVTGESESGRLLRNQDHEQIPQS